MTVGALRDKILAADDLPREQVQTDEWAPFGVPFVYVRGLTGSERDAYERSLVIDGKPKRNLTNIRSGFAAMIIVSETGEREFTDKDVELLGGKSAVVLDRICTVGLRLSGMVEDEENPSTGDLEETNSSGSPLPSE